MAVTVEMRTQVSQFYYALFGRAPDAEGLGYWVQQLSGGKSSVAVADEMYAVDAARAYYPAFATNEEIVKSFYLNTLGRPADAEGLAYWTAALNAPGATEGSVINDLIFAVVGYTGTDADALASQALFNNKVEVGQYYGENNGDVTGATAALASVTADPATVAPAKAAIDAAGVADGLTFDIDALEAADGADIMRLTGDMDARIDLTANSNQVKGLDLDGDGVIELNGVENNNPTTQDTEDFEIVDAYSRDLLNQGNLTENFLGDIAFDGTGFTGDGANADGNLDGNIFLGGLGADTALGGIGNDFMTGGGVADPVRPFDTNENGIIEVGETANFSDELFGGRNADFFFAELSLLDSTDGNNLTIHGGQTSDDAAVGNNTPQDSDWLLLEVSDDEDGTTVNLFDEADLDEDQSVTTGAGRTIVMDEIEHVDASGNLYGFVNGIDVALGGAGSVVDTDDRLAQNVGIGSSAQLNIIGSAASNILIGGFDNDRIDGGTAGDLLMGGNLNYLNNANLLDIVNNGMDELIGGAGADNIVFEADGGIVEGGADQNQDDAEVDTLWLTRESFGTATSADLTAGGLRFDLGVGKEGGVNNYAGYGGADAGGTAEDFTADQTNYADADNRVQVQDVENVIATGLGAIDYLAAGTNDPELSFNNQQNHRAIVSDLDLRGTTGDNTLYAAAGADLLEGREGNDLLSGGEGVDDFVFDLQGGDDLDVIWRQADTNGDNLWDVDADGNGDGAMARINLANQSGLMGEDFGKGEDTTYSASKLTVDFTATDLAPLNKFLIDFSVQIGSVTFAVTDAADLQALKDATTAAEVQAVVHRVFNAIDTNVSATVSGNVVTVTDAPTATASGRTMTNINVSGTVTGTSETFTNPDATFIPAGSETTNDRLIFAAYDDRADGELVDDDAVFGGDTLGANAYAQDLVVGFNVDGSTVLAERQAFQIDLENLAVQDEVTVSVNGVQYTLTVGKELDGTLIAGETTQAFALRMSNYINDFLDDDTAAGDVASTTDGTGDDGDLNNDGDLDDTILGVEEAGGQDVNDNTGSFILTQSNYAGEETVFMNVTVDVDDNSSNGEGASATVTNESSTDITLYQYNGRNAGLNAENVLFVGDSGVGPDGTTYSENSRAVLATAATAGGNLFGSDAIVVNVTADDDVASSALEGINGAAIFFNDAENATTGNNDNYAIHGDDQLIGGDGLDIVRAGTGDDRIYGSLGLDNIDGGKELYLVDGVVRVLNDFEAAAVDALPATISIEQIADSDFDDTLVYQQSDFGVVGAGGATFNIALDLSANKANGGAGRVIVNGAAANTTLFTNMENIRTVSGNGTLIGQGNDTLDLSISVDPITGLTVVNGVDTQYDLTAAGGDVLLDRNDDGDWADAGELIAAVDGVENVSFGTGDDVLNIDETEAGKNNAISGGTGDDTVSYAFDIGGNNDFNPAVTLTVNGGGAGVDWVDMTAGALGLDEPRDTLTSIENINFTDAMENPGLDDTLDVTNVTDAVVDFVNGQVRNGATNAVEVNIGDMVDFEIVNADFNDTVVVADADTMAGNSNANDAALTDVAFESFLSYDLLDERGTDPVRMTVADLRAVAGGTASTADSDDIPEAENIGLFTFNMGPDTDRIDYSNESDTIAVAPNLVASSSSFNILVDDNSDGSLNDNNDRVDVVTGVEQVVASQGDSIIDLTANVDAAGNYVNKNVVITYQAQADADLVDAWDAADGATNTDARYEFSVLLEDADNSTPFDTLRLIEYRDADALDDLAVAGAYWNRVEGSDGNETVQFTSSQETVEHELNLRGGDNTVLYNLQTNGVEVTVDSLTNGVTDLEIEALDITGAGTGVVDDVTAYNALNDVATGSLTVYGSTLFRDSIDLASINDNNAYLLGTLEDGLSKLEVTFGTVGGDVELTLIGFENLTDGAGDDIYIFDDLTNFFDTFEAVVDTAGDSDTLKLQDGALETDSGVTWADNTIEMDDLEDSIDGTNDATENFDFDTLDITEVTEVIEVVDTNDAGETVILGDMDLIGDADATIDVQGFETIAFTDALLASGTSFTVDMDAGEFLDSGSNVLFTFNAANVFDFSRLTSGVTINTVDLGAAGVTLIGDPVDTLRGANGNDILVGGPAGDTLDGGVIAEVLETRTFGFNNGGTLGSNFTNAGTSSIVITDGTGTITLLEDGTIEGDVDGAGATAAVVLTSTHTLTDSSDNDAVGNAIAAISDADWATYLPEFEIADVSYEAVGNVLTFTYASGEDPLIAADLSLTVNDAGAAGTLEANTIVVDGNVANSAQGDIYSAETNSADVYAYNAAAESNAAGRDTLQNFDDSDLIVLDESFITDTTITVTDKGDALNFASLTAAGFFAAGNIAVGSDGVNGRIWVDVNADNNLDSGDMEIVVAGATNADDFDSAADYALGMVGTGAAETFDFDDVVADLTVVGLGGSDTFTFAYSGGASSSSVNNTASAAVGFDTVYVSAGDTLDLTQIIAVVEAALVVSVGAPADGDGDTLLASLNTDFTANDDGVANVEAMLIQFTSGAQYLVVDGGDQSINGSDVVIEIVGAVTGLQLVDGNAVIV